jgi:hypothetical protein
MAPPWHRKHGTIFFAHDYYHYAKIFTKEGREIIITCLMVPRVEDAMRTIDGVQIELEKRFFTNILTQ